MVALKLILYREYYALTEIGDQLIPVDDASDFHAILRFGRKTTVVSERHFAPPGGKTKDGFRLIAIEGEFALDSVGVIASVAAPLADSGISLFAFSFWDSDAFLVQEGDLPRVVQVLSNLGHELVVR